MGVLDDVDLACSADGSKLGIARELADLLDKVAVGATRRVDVQVGVDTAQNLVLHLRVALRDETGRKTQRQIGTQAFVAACDEISVRGVAPYRARAGDTI